MKNISISFFTFLNLFLLACCSKEEPCPTCFENIVTCKVNGKEWRSNCVSNDPLFGCRAISCHYSYFNLKGLNMSAVNDHDGSVINIDQFSGYGGAKLGQNSIENRELTFTNRNINGNCSRVDTLNKLHKNYLIIDGVDTINFIIEGRFSFQVTNLYKDTVTVTDGHFKTKFIF